MERLHLGAAIPDRFRDGIIALGNFDGFHLGHQAVVGRAVARAFHEGRPTIVATFDPHPVSYFQPELPPFRLTSLNQRERLFGAAGADAMLVFEFDRTLALTSADDFVARLLAGEIGAAGVVTGEDFTYGVSRSGTVSTLRSVGAAHGIAAEAITSVAINGEAISSSRIREALVAGDPGRATRLMSRPFAIEGLVEHGDKRGRTLGYPTANLRLGGYLRPAYGIYAVTVRLDDGQERPGVASLGVRPTFEPPVELLETYLFDFDGDLYGHAIEVSFHAFLRGEEKFDSMDALVVQMRADEAAARALLRSSPRT